MSSLTSQYTQHLSRSTILTASASALLLSAGVTWCIHDYRKYLALGPGGPPYNPLGWAVVTFIVRPFALSARDATWTGDYPVDGAHADILALPVREEPRAEVGGIAPHRQLSQHSDESMKSLVRNLFANAELLQPAMLTTKRSLYERHNTALFIRPEHLTTETAVTSRGEVGHVHPDGSIHLYVSPADARVLIEKRWAERHRLARRIPLLPGFQSVTHIGETYLMIYGPRNEDEVKVVATVLRNSIRFMAGTEDVRSIGWEEKL